MASLTRGEVVKLSRLLKAHGKRLPAVGRCTLFRSSPGSSTRVVPHPDRYASEVCRDARGYYLVRSTTAFAGHKRRRRARR